MTELNLESEVVEDVEIYDGPPDSDGPVANENGDQDDEIDLGGGLGLLARFAEQRNRDETLAWFATHKTASQIGFDPDNMCLKVSRTARNLGPKYLTAKAAQDATPLEHRVHEVRNLRKTMVLYYDDPHDSNRAGHVVTLIGRVPGFDPGSLRDLLVVTNTVKANELVVVRGDYFEEHWGDEFQFGATWLNGFELDWRPVPEFESKIEKFQDGGPVYHLNLLWRAGEDRPAARTAYDAIIRQVNSLPDHPNFVRVREFKNGVHSKAKVMDMELLNQAVEALNNRDGKIKRVRDEIRRIIGSLPDV